MRGPQKARRSAGILALLLACCASSGCTYLWHRTEDFAETFDLGFTFSAKPQFSLYGSFVSVISLGVSDFKGSFVGMGGGQVGIIRHQNECWGVGYYGEEKVRWGKRRYSHPQGLKAILGSNRLPGPAYCPACVHYVHLLFIGAVANARYGEMVDFVLGFAGIDIARDDGRRTGRRHW